MNQFHLIEKPHMMLMIKSNLLHKIVLTNIKNTSHYKTNMYPPFNSESKSKCILYLVDIFFFLLNTQRSKTVRLKFCIFQIKNFYLTCEMTILQH